MNRIPAGLLDKGTEFFTQFENGVQRAMCFFRGRPYTFKDTPECRKAILLREMLSCQVKQGSMERMVGPNIHRQLEKFTMCNYGSCNDEPDICANGILSAPEYVPCPNRGKCTEEGRGCNNITVNGVTLSMSQTRVFKLAYLDNKEIADRLFLSVETVRTHMRDIQDKTGMNGKLEMVHWATIKGII